MLGRVDRRYAYLGGWLMEGAIRSGMARPDAPAYGGELIVWICDRAFEYMFREERSASTENEIMELAMHMLSQTIAEYTTDLGREGIGRDQFLETFGEYKPPTRLLD